jgi:hypothetical protein
VPVSCVCAAHCAVNPNGSSAGPPPLRRSRAECHPPNESGRSRSRKPAARRCSSRPAGRLSRKN